MSLIPSESVCRKCAYPLPGLPSNICPECGAAFDPTDLSTFDFSLAIHRRRNHSATIGNVLLSPFLLIPFMWMASMIPPFGSIALFATSFCVIVNLAKKRWLASILIVAGSPLAVFTLWGVADYCRGQGNLRFVGMPSMKSRGVDPELRCERAGGGCVVSGDEWIRIVPYNATLTGLISVFGPMPGSYLGPYPTRDECLVLLENASPVQVGQIQNGLIKLGERTMQLDAGVGASIFQFTVWSYATSEAEVAALCKMIGGIEAVLEKTVIILHVPLPASDNQKAALIVLIDSKKGRPFAYYSYGNHTTYYPHVRWSSDN